MYTLICSYVHFLFSSYFLFPVTHFCLIQREGNAHLNKTLYVREHYFGFKGIKLRNKAVLCFKKVGYSHRWQWHNSCRLLV